MTATPSRHERYYFVYSNGSIDCADWRNCEWDKLLYKLGNCYPTQEQAEANRQKWIDFYASDEVLDI